MFLYFLFIRIAALFGHRKARLLVKGQAEAQKQITECDRLRNGNTIWFHAASVGEFEQARPIIERLRTEHPDWPILLTFFSPSGYELRKNYDKVDMVTYLPFATRRRARKFVEALNPRMAIFVKYEFWPAYLRLLAKKEIKTYLVSAIFRPSQAFFRPLGKPYRRLLTCFTHIFVQDEASATLLAKYNICNVSVTGDTRFDRVEAISQQAKEIRNIALYMGASNIRTIHREPLRTIVAGSTWPKDEELLARYVRTHEDVRLILVPHEIDEQHMHRIFCIFDGRIIRYTQANPMNMSHVRTMVVDTIGLLSSIYRYADIAYVGGGFGVGIHNTIEAAVYGLPVVFGPNYQNFREAHGLINCGAGTSVSDYKTLEAALDDAFAARQPKGKQAREYVQSELGATERIYSRIFE